ncbi:phosphatase [Gemmiger gallinarum]|nr:phosphatase [Gemmiger gallinarum]
MMKKSTFGAALAFLAAAAGVLTAVALYLRRREQELDEYEKLLFSDEYDDEEAEDDEQDDTASADAEPLADPDTDGDISF